MKPAYFAPLLLLAACGLLTACGGVYKISDDPASGGIPFLPIVSVDVTSMTFEQRWAEVELSVTYEPDLTDAQAAQKKPLAATDAKKPDKGAAASSSASDAQGRAEGRAADAGEAKPRFKTRQIRYLTDIAYANTLLKVFNEESTPVAASEKLTLRLKNDPDKKLGLEEPAPLAAPDVLKLPIASVERRRDQVPGAKQLYINVPIPAGGSGSAVVELSPNGTLSKSTAKVKNELINTIVKTAGTVVSSIVGLSGSSQGAAGVPIVDARMRVTVVRRVYVVTLQRPSDDATPCDIAALLRVDPVVAPPPESKVCSASLLVVVLRGEDIDKPTSSSNGAGERDKAASEGDVRAQ